MVDGTRPIVRTINGVPDMSENESMLSRRQMVHAGTGLLAAPFLMSIGGAASAQENAQASAGGAVDINQMQNPLTQYPKPPFKRQHQDPPGLASKMDPKPDHGETSY